MSRDWPAGRGDADHVVLPGDHLGKGSQPGHVMAVVNIDAAQMMLLCFLCRHFDSLHGHHDPKISTTIEHRRGC